jgi:hypothetical protein
MPFAPLQRCVTQSVTGCVPISMPFGYAERGNDATIVLKGTHSVPYEEP